MHSRSASGIELVSDELVDVILLRDGLPGPGGLLSSPPAATKRSESRVNDDKILLLSNSVKYQRI